MHEWQVVHNLPSNTNNHNRTTATNGKSSGADTTLDTGALKHRSRRAILVVAEQLADSLTVALVTERGVNLVRNDARDQRLGEGEAGGLNIGDDKWVSA